MHYSDDQLRQLLDDRSTDPPDDDLRHLEDCLDCRERLSKLSGEGDWLRDWMDSVGQETSEQPAVLNSSSSVLIKVGTSDGIQSEIECDAVRLDFLATPRHPELLGRLGRYDIERLIGSGGFGVVLKAHDSELNRVVAIKVLAPHLQNSGPARKRFAREAQASAAVVHDHVVPIYDVVVESATCYFVMQYISGPSLQERVDRQGPLAIEDVLRIAAQTASGLQAAHEQGLIHRDVKPGNVLLEDSVDRVLISDFGLARASDDASLTRTGTITGTPHYMSPEQARGQTVDARSDLFSLGSVIYFMCTGRSPFRAPQMMAVLNRICHESHRPLEEVNTAVPYELSDIVDRLLAKKPDGRYSSAAAVRRDVNRLLSDFQSGKLRQRRRRPLLQLPRIRAIAGLAGALLLAFAAGSYVLSQRQTVVSAVSTNPPATAGITKATTAEPPVARPLIKKLSVADFSELQVLAGKNFLKKQYGETVSVVEALERLAVARPVNSMAGDVWYQQVTDLNEVLEQLEQKLNPLTLVPPETQE